MNRFGVPVPEKGLFHLSFGMLFKFVSLNLLVCSLQKEVKIKYMNSLSLFCFYFTFSWVPCGQMWHKNWSFPIYFYHKKTKHLLFTTIISQWYSIMEFHFKDIIRQTSWLYFNWTSKDSIHHLLKFILFVCNPNQMIFEANFIPFISIRDYSIALIEIKWQKKNISMKKLVKISIPKVHH